MQIPTNYQWTICFTTLMRVGEIVDKNKLKAEIERIENIKRNKSSKYIHDELNQYLKLLKRQLKQAEKE